MSIKLKLLVYLLLYVLAWGGALTHAEDLDKPNILLLLADDFGMNDSGLYKEEFHQAPILDMPHLQALASEGVLYSRFYTESTCSASRAALLTGQYPARNGFIPVGRGISSDIVTLPKALKTLGYQTHLVGKWHVGEINEVAKPWHQGFDTSFGFLSQWMLQGPDTNGERQLKSPTYHNPWLINGPGEGKRYLGHLEDILTAQTVKLIHSNKPHQPWFIYHAFLAPHTPLQPAERYLREFGSSSAGRHKALLKQMDDNLNLMFDALKQSGQWDNTIILFVSDNGAAGKNKLSNAPFLGEKASYEEGGIRTPMVIKWSKQFSDSSPKVRADVVSIMDIYPSLYALLSKKDSVSGMVFDGRTSLYSQADSARGFSGGSAPHYFWGFGELSVFSENFSERLIKQWNDIDSSENILLKYSAESIPHQKDSAFLDRFFSFGKKKESKLWENFLNWRDEVRQVPVSIEKLGLGYVVRGRDFLRTPINPSFSVSLSFSSRNRDIEQSLLFQKGILNLSIKDGKIIGNVYGLSINGPAIEVNKCYRVILSGEFYDRFNTAKDTTRPSRIHLIVNGVLVDTTTVELESLADVAVNEPTYIGQRGSPEESPFVGFLSPPKFFSTQLLPDDKPIPSRLSKAELPCE